MIPDPNSSELPGPAAAESRNESRALLQAFDWSQTSLGPLSAWPNELRATVDVLVDSPVAQVLMWGQDHIMIYNDAYAVVAAGNHPAAFGGLVSEIWPEVWDFNRRVLRAAFRGEVQSFRDQPMLLCRNGVSESVYFDLFYTPIRTAGGTVAGVLCTVIENTRRVLALRDLRRSNERFEAAVETMHGVLWTTDAGGRMVGPQPGWQALTGQGPEQYEGEGWLNCVDANERAATIDAWRSAVAAEAPFVFEHRARRQDGVWRQFAIRALPVREESGHVREWVGVHTDVTETREGEAKLREHAELLEAQALQRERAEDQLRQLNETLESRIIDAIAERRRAEVALAQSQKMETIGQLTGGVAHDFNNLLQVVSGNLQLLSRDVAGNARAEARIANALAGVARGSKLASQLLAFGRRQALEPKVVNVTRFVREMDDILRRAIGEGVEIETVVGGGLWNTFIDPTQIENALLNLALNARDAMDGQGRLTIELGNASLDDDYVLAHNDATPGQYVMLAVSDTGTGMPPDIIDKVFEPFFSTKAEGKGSGLGLSMVYGFVRQSGGHVNIYSEVGQGTTIRLYLPRATEAEDIEVDVDVGPVAGGTETVLVVEDDEAVRATVVEMLADLGYRVLKAVDAQSALNVVESGIPIDMLFTDVVMPGSLKSPELARKAKERLPDIAVLFTSGYTENSIVHGGRLDAGVNLLSKPYTREALARKFRHVLANQAQANAARRGKSPSLAPSMADTNNAPRSELTVMLVEDEPLIRMDTAEMLQDLGHIVVEAGSAEEAITALQTVPVDVLVTDVNLPGMSGPELARHALGLRPELGIVFATGDRYVQGMDQLASSAVTILLKPYDPAGLARAVASVAETGLGVVSTLGEIVGD